ncbi:MAG: hypothetical protein QM811_08935 [Pirellulales bacterium]
MVVMMMMIAAGTVRVVVRMLVGQHRQRCAGQGRIDHDRGRGGRFFRGRLFVNFVRMKMKNPLQEKRDHETGQRQLHHRIDAAVLAFLESEVGVRNQVQDADSQQDARDETQRELHPSMRNFDESRRITAGQRRQSDQNAIKYDERKFGHVSTITRKRGVRREELTSRLHLAASNIVPTSRFD